MVLDHLPNSSVVDFPTELNKFFGVQTTCNIENSFDLRSKDWKGSIATDVNKKQGIKFLFDQWQKS